MLEKIGEDIKNAMKNKEKEKLNALRYLKSMLLENKTSKSPKPDLDVISALHKKLKDSKESYPLGSEEQTNIEREISIIAEYLPTPLTKEEVTSIIKSIIDKQSAPNMGMVMKELTPQIKGRFDGKEASQMVNEILKS